MCNSFLLLIGNSKIVFAGMAVFARLLSLKFVNLASEAIIHFGSDRNFFFFCLPVFTQVYSGTARVPESGRKIFYGGSYGAPRIRYIRNWCQWRKRLTRFTRHLVGIPHGKEAWIFIIILLSLF